MERVTNLFEDPTRNVSALMRFVERRDAENAVALAITADVVPEFAYLRIKKMIGDNDEIRGEDILFLLEVIKECGLSGDRQCFYLAELARRNGEFMLSLQVIHHFLDNCGRNLIAECNMEIFDYYKRLIASACDPLNIEIMNAIEDDLRPYRNLDGYYRLLGNIRLFKCSQSKIKELEASNRKKVLRVV